MKNTTIVQTFTGAYGTTYAVQRQGNPRYDHKGTRTDGHTIIRTGPRPVDIKRSIRAKRKYERSVA